MEIIKFKELLKDYNAIRINEEYIIFNDYELYSFVKTTAKKYKSIEKLVEDNPTIKEIIESTEEFRLDYDGGRGSSSSNGKMGGGFNHADGRGRKSFGEVKYPAEFNVGGRFNSYEEALKRFQSKYKDAEVEYGITVDEQGYVHRHVQGGSTSVAIGGNKGEMVIHNHPSGGNFSDSDLISTASDQSRGIVATSSNAKKKSTYTFVKTNKFKAKDFIKGVKRAQWPTHLNYNKGADWWLKRNQKVYGYKYTHSGTFE